jgi:DNA-binding NarL/FixJ family response regulator
LLADDHVLVAQSLAQLLKDDFDVLRIVRSGSELIEAARTLRPDVIVTDLGMPDLGGMDAMRRLAKDGMGAKVIFLTMHADAALATEALRAGAAGYVLKSSASEELFTAIREALSGGSYVSPRLLGDVLVGPRGRGHGSITPRQREVLRLIVTGLTLKEVAAAMHLSPRTVETHKYEMMHALGVETTAALIQHAVRHNLVPS